MPPRSYRGKGAIVGGRYELGHLLGRGAFGKVYTAKNLVTAENVAMKVVAKERVAKAGMAEQVKREIAAMKAVKHPNIVELYEVMATKSKIYFAMELVSGGDLFSIIARGGRLGEDRARRHFRQLVSAVDLCHSRGVYHRDLKLENLLLDGEGNVKVADFGLSAFAEHARADGLLHTQCGTPAYVSPEVLAKGGYDGAKADVWSCGVILYALLTGSLPFQGPNVLDTYRRIFHGEFRCPSWISPSARWLIQRLLDPDPDRRITIASLMESSWFNSREQQQHAEARPLPTEEGLGEPTRMNAFHLISLSQGLDLSPLFEDKGEGIRFTTRESASGVVAVLEGVAARAGGRFKVSKSSAAGVRLEGEERGRKGGLAVAAEMFAVAPDVLVVEVNKAGGDTIEYRRFCTDELLPALKDIVWASSTAS